MPKAGNDVNLNFSFKQNIYSEKNVEAVYHDFHTPWVSNVNQLQRHIIRL